MGDVFWMEFIGRQAGWLDIAEFLSIKEPGDDDIFNVIKEFDELPCCIENIYYGLLLDAICYSLEGKYGLEASNYINDLDTHLHVEGEEISTLEDLERVIEEHEQEALSND